MATLILAHARAYDVYNRLFRPTQNGLVGITLNSDWAQPENPDDENDILASEIAMSMYLGGWAYPIYGEDGDYSQIMKDTLINAGEWSQFYEFSEEEKELNRDSSNFFGLNHYGSGIVRYNEDKKYKFQVNTSKFYRFEAFGKICTVFRRL